MLSTETRQSIKRMHAEGSSVTDIAKALSISRTTVYAYMRDQFRGMRPQRRGSVSKLSEANQAEGGIRSARWKHCRSSRTVAVRP